MKPTIPHARARNRTRTRAGRARPLRARSGRTAVRLCGLVVLLLTSAAAPASAASITWNNAGGTGLASSGANWVGGVVPGPADIAVFNTTSTAAARFDAAFSGSVGGISLAAGYTGTVSLERSLAVGSSGWTQAAGTADAGAQMLSIAGAFSQSGSTSTFRASSTTTSFAGNFSRTAGTFEHSSGTVELTGAAAATIAGSTAFHHLSIPSPGKVVSFTAGTEQRVAGSFSVAGAPGTPVTLQSTTTGSQWRLSMLGPRTVGDASVRDAGCGSTAGFVEPTASTDGGNNGGCWLFGAVRPVTGLVATGGDGQVRLDWQNPGSAAFGMLTIYRATDDSALGTAVHTTTDTTVTTWTDTALTNGTTYRYRVLASRADGTGATPQVGGLQGFHHADASWGPLRWQEQAQQVDFTWEQGMGPSSPLYPGPGQGVSYSNRWTGSFHAPASGSYTLFGMAGTYESATLKVNGAVVATGSGCGSISGCDWSGTVALTAGWHWLEFTHSEGTTANWGGRARISWSGPGFAKQAIPAGELATHPLAEATPTSGSLSVSAPAGGLTVRGAAAPVDVAWSTASTSPAASTVRLGYSLDDGATVTWVRRSISDTGSTTWSPPSGLQSANARVVVEARNAAGRVLRTAVSGRFSIDTTLATGLADVSELRAVPGNGQVALSWTNPASASFDHVNIYRSSVEGVLGTRVAQTAATTWTDTGLTNGATWHYTVRAADAGERESSAHESLLSGSYYDDAAATTLRWQEPSPGLDLSWDQGLGPASPLYPGVGKGTGYATRFHGRVLAPTDGHYTFYTVTREYEDVATIVDGTQVNTVSFCMTTGGCSGPGTIWLDAGWHSVEVLHKEPSQTNWGARLQLSWSGPGITKQVVPVSSIGRPVSVEATPVAGAITVTRPTSGDVLRVDAQSETVDWTATTTPATSTVRLGYSLDDGTTVVWFERAAANDGSAPWILPSEAYSTTTRIVAEARAANGRLLLRTQSGRFTLDTRTTASVTDVAALAATAGDGDVRLTWTDPPDAAFDHVNIYRSTSETRLGTRVAQVAAGTGTWLDTSATNGTTWYYTARAADLADREPWVRDPQLSGSYYADETWTNLRWQEPTGQVAFTWQQNAGPLSSLYPGAGQGSDYTSRWFGKVKVSSAGTYNFYAYAQSYESAWVYVDGILVANGTFCGTAGGCEWPGTIGLEAGWHSVEVRHHEDYMPNGGGAMRVSWRGPGIAKQVIPVGSFGRSPKVDATPAAGTLAVTRPAGGEVLAGSGSTTPIEWDASTLTAATAVRLGYSLDDGATVTWVHRGVTGGTWQWPIPGDVSSTTARVVAEARAADGRAIRRALSNRFSIDTTRAAGLGNVTALTAVPGSNTVQLDWVNPASASLDHVNIYRSTSEGIVGTRVAQVVGTSWTDATAANGTTYHYTVRAADSGNRESVPDPKVQGSYYGDVAWTVLRWQEPADQINFTWPTGPISDQAPGVTQANGYSTRWYGAVNAAADGLWTFYAATDGYDRMHVTVDGVPVVVHPGCATIMGCEHVGALRLSAGWHAIEVRHTRAASGGGGSLARLSWAGPSVAKQVVAATSLGSWPTADATPSDSTLALTKPLDGGRLGGAPNAESIEWTGAATPAGTVDVRWSLDNGATWRYVARRLSTAGPFSWTLPTGVQTTTAAIRVDHLDAAGRMVRTSISRNVDIDTRVSPPSGVTTVDEAGGLRVNWTAPADPSVAGYTIYRADAVDGPWSLLGTVAGTTFVDTTGTPGRAYRYRVRSRDAAQRESIGLAVGSVRGSYFNGAAFNTAQGSQDDATVNFDWAAGSPGLVTQSDGFSARWVGRIHSPTAGTWSYQLSHDDGVRMYVGGALVLDRWTTCSSCTSELRLALTAGWNDVRIEFYENTGNARMQLRHRAPADASYSVVPSTALAQETSVAGTWNPPTWITIDVTSGATANLGTALPSDTRTTGSTVEVATNAAGGYQLHANGNTDTDAMSGPAPAVVRHRPGGVEPIAWPLADWGFGLAVASASGGKDTTRWGSGTTPASVSTLNYAAPTATTSTLLHQRTSYDTDPDEVVVGYRVTLDGAQPPGSYSGTVTYTATALP